MTMTITTQTLPSAQTRAAGTSDGPGSADSFGAALAAVGEDTGRRTPATADRAAEHSTRDRTGRAGNHSPADRPVRDRAGGDRAGRGHAGGAPADRSSADGTTTGTPTTTAPATTAPATTADPTPATSAVVPGAV
ncbi:hypothetical protein, partial [Curtobacterium pusillum]